MNPSDIEQNLMTPSDILKMMAKRADDDDKPPRTKLAPDIEAIRLSDALVALSIKHEFRTGMIVRQKPQAIIYRQYGDNDMAIVVCVLDKPIVDRGDEIGSPYYRHRADMIIGSIEAAGNGREYFTTYHVDSRRFEPVAHEELELQLVAPEPEHSGAA